ncbi:MAG TPA: hypothetical protein VGI92_00465 [Gemmatimonadales bacterium]|jgi:hypothetical protein
MLTSDKRDRRTPRSVRSEYDQFIEQRIEEYKDSLPRAEILSIGDEAMAEMSGTLQFQLTEVVLREQVDAIIRRRLKLPSFRRWRERHIALRAAQIQPGHWGLGAHDPVALLGDLIEDNDPVLVIGAADGACALFLAARGALVHVCDPDIAAVYGLENRAVTEQLGAAIECTVVQLERFEPFSWFVACVIETGALVSVPVSERAALIERLKSVTPASGRHAIMPANPARGSDVRLSSDALRTLYGDWEIQRDPAPSTRKPRNLGFTAIKPAPSQIATDTAVSE